VAFMALCHLKMIRLISIHDRVDTDGKLFRDTSPDDIRIASGYQSRSSIFRILNNYHIPLNRGPHCGPLKKKG
jgi:hypothetical protein